MNNSEKETRAKSIANIVAELMLVKQIKYDKKGITLVGELYANATAEALADSLAQHSVRGTLSITGDTVEVLVREGRYSLGPVPLINLFLFLATILTTASAGAAMEGNNPLTWNGFLSGLPFSATLMSILLFHEFGHYFASKRNKVKATMPYFIPVPYFIGTFGAFIKMESPIASKRSLMEIGAAGPIAGFLVAVPALLYGLLTSEVKQVMPDMPVVRLGEPIIMKILTFITHPNLPEGFDIFLNNVAFAGWIGLLVTALNLIPIGQLDGGHISYALFGRKHVAIARWAFIPILLLSILSINWLVWAALIFFFIRFRHPPVLDEDVPLKPFHRWLGYVSIAILVLTFTPIPFST